MSSNSMTVKLIPAATASEDSTVSDLASLINAAYAKSEADITADGVDRITLQELRRRIRAEELYGAYSSGKIVGVGRLHYMPDRPLDTEYGIGKEYGVLNDLWDEAAPEGHEGIDHSATTGSKIATFSMLAVHESLANKGVGNRLVQYLEDVARAQGCHAMEIQLQEPLEKNVGNGFSEVLRKWYERRGYVVKRELSMDEFLPGFAAVMAKPVKMSVMRKAL